MTTSPIGPKPGNVTDEIIAAMDQPAAPRWDADAHHAAVRNLITANAAHGQAAADFDDALASAIAATNKALDVLDPNRSRTA